MLLMFCQTASKGDIANPVIGFHIPVVPDSLGQLLNKRLDNIGFEQGIADIIGRFKTGFLFGNLEGFTLYNDQRRQPAVFPSGIQGQRCQGEQVGITCGDTTI
mgnify:CR=1 FL=1